MCEKSLVPGETLMYDTRHHWIVLIGPLLLSVVGGAGCRDAWSKCWRREAGVEF